MTGPWFRSLAAIVVLVTALAGVPLAQLGLARSGNSKADSSSTLSTQLSKMTVTAGPNGVLIEWRTSFEIDNLGFNIYRVRNGEIIRINRPLVRGSALIVGPGRPLYAGKSYTWFDPEGTRDCEYYLEDIDLSGKTTQHDRVTPTWDPNLIKRAMTAEPTFIPGATPATPTTQQEWSGSAPTLSTELPTGLIDEQWRIAALPSLKIGVKNEGWYHLTQAQLVAAGFDVSANAQNLRMFVGGRELAIRVSRTGGPLGSSDYVEFYGVGLDISTTDTQMYYLVNDTQPGLRIAPLGEVTPNSTPTPTPIPSPTPSASPSATATPSPSSSVARNEDSRTLRWFAGIGGGVS